MHYEHIHIHDNVYWGKECTVKVYLHALCFNRLIIILYNAGTIRLLISDELH